jgi:ferredoxin--NADP+ reductase
MPTPIVAKEALIPGRTSKLVLDSPLIAKKALPGNFVMLRVGQNGERFPLTIADTDPEAGTITIIYLVVGKSTALLETLGVGDSITDVCGPLGRQAPIERVGPVICVGGGTGIAAMHHLAKGHAKAGNPVTAVIGAANAESLLMEKELSLFCEKILITTMDGSRGAKGIVTDALKTALDEAPPAEVVAVGPVPMMEAVAKMTLPYKVKTIVSLNSIMVDGVGMCGACRVTVAGKTRFTCVEGPEFDGHEVDFDELRLRLSAFKEQEKQSMELFEAARREAGGCGCSGTSAPAKG